MAGTIPVIDFSDYGLDVAQENVTENDLKQLADKVYEAFSIIGFCYITNHGIPESQIAEAFKVSKDFFDQPDSVKQKLNPDRKVGDLKEAYNFTLTDDVKFMKILDIPTHCNTMSNTKILIPVQDHLCLGNLRINLSGGQKQ
ncbi:hypothetical protein KUTeg_022982 [Tegillarca granosa]|uniref:Non-haem dioxygenase N-terminal domain-containing protein n=1 Tax=Tegillarca granosa TaxID=220873 RepID=A0ABQ9E4X4_TEGGR|nr:hypothetical protein KUTeg_022982 [Tegillarca granosa]